jgi:hypothetical protein
MHPNQELTVNALQILRDRTTGQTTTPAAWACPLRASTNAGLRLNARRQAGRATIWLAAVLAAVALTISSLLAVRFDPAIIGVPASAPGAEADTTRMARAPTSSRDIQLRCFYDALASLGGTVDGPGYQRTDPACQRR